MFIFIPWLYSLAKHSHLHISSKYSLWLRTYFPSASLVSCTLGDAQGKMCLYFISKCTFLYVLSMKNLSSLKLSGTTAGCYPMKIWYTLNKFWYFIFILTYFCLWVHVLQPSWQSFQIFTEKNMLMITDPQSKSLHPHLLSVWRQSNPIIQSCQLTTVLYCSYACIIDLKTV